ncbi:MAG: ABC transporter ATP-binding protein [Hyphomicrobiaceae bacterium]
MSSIRLEHVQLTLTSRAGPVAILQDVDLTIEDGETVGIVGPSGSGKSSLLMVAAGLEPATSGQVVVAGRDISRANENDRAIVRSQAMGIVFQSFHLMPTMTARENVALPLELRGASDGLERADRALNEVGLGHRREHFPAELSGGEQQRVAIARAIVGQPRILFADEPTGNLDQRTGQEIIELLLRIGAEHGTTLVLVTHDAALARRCQRQITLGDGRIVKDERIASA